VSGIVGMFERDGRPIDQGLLRALTDYLGFRGPNGSKTSVEGSAGFGHALLRTGPGCDCQPASVDERFWITADARLDCREELEADLKSAGQRIEKNDEDSILILHSYAAWKEDSPRHLRGDFAFAIWDAEKGHVFLARDHFGIKPLYYAAIGDLFLFSNTLNCLRLHPHLSDDLNETAIADFLLFGLNLDQATTTFKDIRRLPPAHTLTVSKSGLRLTKYWSPPTDGRIRYRRPGDYAERFQELLQAAVKDRLPRDRAGILLSGGLDSTTIAAFARKVAARSGGKPRLHGYSVVYDSLIPDGERHYASQAAEFLGIPLRFLPVDHLKLFDGWNDPSLNSPEPVDDPFFAGLFDQFRMIEEECRVVLDGEGNDNLMHFEMWPFAKDLARKGEWGHFFAVASQFLWLRKPALFRIPRRLKTLMSRAPETQLLPVWISAEFARRAEVQGRMNAMEDLAQKTAHPILPKAHASLSFPQWTHMFENVDSGVTRTTVEVRFPFLDLRIVNFVLGLEPFPWLFNKQLLRRAMIGQLPESVRLRPKTPLGGDPVLTRMSQSDSGWLDRVPWDVEMERFVDRSKLEPFAKLGASTKIEPVLRAICLNFWLQSTRDVRYNLGAEARHG
jgi:asparagine synthase (glutamine-hydrolysing)